MIAQDLQLVLVRHVGESIRNSASWLQEYALDVDRLDIMLERVFIQAFSSFRCIPLLVQLQLPISLRQLSTSQFVAH